MTASFKLALDTVTHLTAEINGGAESSPGSNVTLELGLDADAIEIKVWGQIDPDSPLNTGLGITEGEAAWMPATASLLVALEEGEGPRQLHARIKDDVWNEATATTSIFVGTPTPLPAPSRPGGRPAPPPREVQRRTISSRSGLRLRSRGAARAAIGQRGRAGTSSTARLRVSLGGSGGIETATAGAARVRLGSAAAVESDTTWKLGKSLGEETQAAITLLL